jgi:hypothetical protein
MALNQVRRMQIEQRLISRFFGRWEPARRTATAGSLPPMISFTARCPFYNVAQNMSPADHNHFHTFNSTTFFVIDL